MNRASFIVYLVLVSICAALSVHIGTWVYGEVSVATAGALFVTMFAALFVSELKQESIGQLYQALAASYFKTAEQAAFTEAALGKIRTIRKVFLLSNALKLLGSLAGVYLINEKQIPTAVHPAWVIMLATFLLLGALICFARLWLEVSAAESLLMDVKFKSIVHARREALITSIGSEAEHDFEADPTAQSFMEPSKKLPVKRRRGAAA